MRAISTAISVPLYLSISMIIDKTSLSCAFVSCLVCFLSFVASLYRKNLVSSVFGVKATAGQIAAAASPQSPHLDSWVLLSGR